ncbi:hypothetical protein TRFO_20815 [Tritrichomonas foetus]|uniref:Initiator binding domain-containing protein n=1 Tax=Tritrichomonas foetus TaxID=1144522 RepID=A0A1J4KF57_9EUKA|nr:hypothetical protein TRFO_20815 [Tritrichomonas foetus]|eukprot:OHT10079.1 hypothetical protein TRFO_20815 [Tritrichomonas foetus]
MDLFSDPFSSMLSFDISKENESIFDVIPFDKHFKDQVKTEEGTERKDNSQKADFLNIPTVERFESAIVDKALFLNPKKINFIPASYWSDKEITFGDVVSDFFQRKNNSHCRFIHKLYNAVKLTEYDSKFIPFVGIQWVNEYVLRINRAVFAKLLGIKAIEGSLFHQQGNFPSHGFVELEPADVRKMFPDFDFSIDRLLMHHDRIFVRGCNEEEVIFCKWKQ